MLLKRQGNISAQGPLPVDLVDNVGQSAPIAADTSPLFYFNAGVPTADAGQAAGTVVVSTLTFKKIGNFLGDGVGILKDSSLVINVGTAFTEEVFYPWDSVEGIDTEDLESQAIKATSKLEDGQYCVDYMKGRIYGKKADATTSLDWNYNVIVQAQPSSGPTSNVNINEFGGAPVSLGQTTMAGSIPVVISSDQSAINVIFGASTSILNGTGTITATGVAQQIIIASTPSKSVLIQNDSANDMEFGNSAGQNYKVRPTEAISYQIDDVNKVYVKGTIGGAFNFNGDL